MSAVSSVVEVLVLAPGQPFLLTARFSYDTANPYEVRLTFGDGYDDPVVWVFARALLSDGLSGPAGNGDVQVAPCPSRHRLTIALASPDGTALLEAPSGDVARFLLATTRLVPQGAEPPRTDVDALITAILTRDTP